MRIAIALALLAVSPALAQQSLFRPDNLYVNPTYNGGASRVVGLGGSYVGIAEGLDGMTMNTASTAHRSANMRSGFTLEPLATMSIPNSTDLDNDGVVDNTNVALLGALGLRMQIFKFGLGVFWRGEASSRCAPPDCTKSLQFAQTDLSVGGALTLLRDQLVVGVAWYRPHATVSVSDEATGALDARTNANGHGAQLGVLVRPEGRPFRVGATFRTAVTAPFEIEVGGAETFQNRPVYRGIATSALLSAGLTWNFFRGAENLNRLSPVAQREYDGLTDEQMETLPTFPEDNTGRLLISAQLDVALPVERATGINGYLTNSQGFAAGEQVMVTPRLGLEHLTVVNRLRLRAGSYLEPSAYPSVAPRLHGTGGFDLRLFELLVNWTASAYFDFANGYQVYGFSLGVW